MAYGLGVDLGTTYTAAAVVREGHVEMAPLGDRSTAMPSVILMRAEGGVLTGDAANRRAATEPDRVAREVKRRLGDPMPVLLGGTPYSAGDLMAAQLREVVAQISEREGGPPVAVRLTHPANWGPYKRELFEQVPRMAGLYDVTMITEPEAAAAHYAANERIADGTTVAVYDLGGGTFDATVLRTTGGGFEILGAPEGVEGLGGVDFDEAVFGHVDRSLDGAVSALDLSDPAATSAIVRLRQDCVLAKEALSSDTEATIPVLLPVAADRGPPDPRRVRDDDPPLGGVDDRLAAARPGVGRHLRRAGGHGAARRRVVAHPAGLPDGLGRARASHVGRRAPEARHRPRRGVARRAAGPRRRSGRAGAGAHVGVPDVRGALPDAGAPCRSAHAARRHPRRRQRAPASTPAAAAHGGGSGTNSGMIPIVAGPRPSSTGGFSTVSPTGTHGRPPGGRPGTGAFRAAGPGTGAMNAGTGSAPPRRHGGTYTGPTALRPTYTGPTRTVPAPSGPRPDRGDRRRPQPGPPDPGRAGPGRSGWSGRHRRSRGTPAVAGRPVRRRRALGRRVAPPDPPDHRRGRARGRPRGRRHLRLPLAVGGGPPPARTDPVGGRGPDPAADVRAAGAGERARDRRVERDRRIGFGRRLGVGRGLRRYRWFRSRRLGGSNNNNGGTWRPSEPEHTSDPDPGGTEPGTGTCCDPTPAPAAGSGG